MEIETKMTPKLYFQTGDGHIEEFGKYDRIIGVDLNHADDPGFYAKDILNKNGPFICRATVEGLDQLIASTTDDLELKMHDITKSLPNYIFQQSWTSVPIKINGLPIIVTTTTYQKRRHHKKRINKKWQKRYGYVDIEVQDKPAIFLNNKVYVTREFFEQLKQTCICHNIKYDYAYEYCSLLI